MSKNFPDSNSVTKNSVTNSPTTATGGLLPAFNLIIRGILKPAFGLFTSRDGGHTREPVCEDMLLYDDDLLVDNHEYYYGLLGQMVVAAWSHAGVEAPDFGRLSIQFWKCVFNYKLTAEADLPSLVHPTVLKRLEFLRGLDNMELLEHDYIYVHGGTRLCWPLPQEDGSVDAVTQHTAADGGIKVTKTTKDRYVKFVEQTMLNEYECGIAAHVDAFRCGMEHQCGGRTAFDDLRKQVTLEVLRGGCCESPGCVLRLGSVE